MQQLNVVVATIDDDRRVRESVQSVLESAGYEAVAFESAEAFLLSGALSSVTCVIADVRLPGMDGTELQQRIRRERRQLAVILITAHDDIPLLIAHFVRRFAERLGKNVEDVPDEVIDTLKHNSWPGNVRELQNVIERAVGATTGPTLRLSERRIHRAAASSRTLAQVERDHIVATLQATNWVLGGWDGAAARLGLSRTTLISRMQRLGISAGSGLRESAGQPAVFRLRSAHSRVVG
jgi:DNA-binding NtrC family response regulator